MLLPVPLQPSARSESTMNFLIPTASRTISSCPMSVRASRPLIRPRSLRSRPLPRFQRLGPNLELSSARDQCCRLTRVKQQRGRSWLTGTWVRSLSAGVHAQILPYSTAIHHQRNTPILPYRHILSLVLLLLTNHASTPRPQSTDLNRALRCLHRIMMHRFTQIQPDMNRQHNSHHIIPSRLPCHRPHPSCLPVRASQV